MKNNIENHRLQEFFITIKNSYYAVMAVVLLVSFLPSLSFSQTLIPTYKSTWVGNTFPGGDKWVQNYIEDMQVTRDGKVYLHCNWDEGGRTNGVYSDCDVLKGKDDDTGNEDVGANSRKATDCQGNTWTIQNWYGRFMAGTTAPVPTGDAAPFIKCSDGREIHDIIDPTAISIDTIGGNCKLYIADNGLDQNIKIYDISASPKLIGSFGDVGGMMSGTPGVYGNKKFWGIRGVGTDKDGNLWVGNSSFNSQSGGTDLRKFSPDGKMVCHLMDLMFVQECDFDPSDPSNVFSSQERISVDYNAPGAWKYESTTISPFSYPDDPRIISPSEVTWMRQIGGKKFMFQTNMYSEYLFVFRFDGEIAVPTAVFSVGWDGQWDKYPWQIDKRPQWDPNGEGNSGRRWLWRDNNGDGAVSADEFTQYSLDYPFNWAINVDREGNVTIGGRTLARFSPNGIDANGVPNYDVTKITKTTLESLNIPAIADANRIKYVEDTDVMYIASGGGFPDFTTIYQIQDWSTKPTLRLVIETGMTTAEAMTADKDYIYACGVQQGAYTNKTGEVDIWDAKTGLPIGYITPDATVKNESGWTDMGYCLNVTSKPNGDRLIIIEEDWHGKNILYTWTPSWSPPAEDQVVITYPIDQSSFYIEEKDSITLKAFVNDVNHSIKRIDFYIDGVKVGLDSTSTLGYFQFPYKNSIGSHTLSVKAIDQSEKVVSTGSSVFTTSHLSDLVVTNMHWSPVNPSDGDLVKFSATVKNIGLGATPDNTTIGGVFFVDGQGVAYTDYYKSALAAGDSVVLQASGGWSPSEFWKAVKGRHTISFQVDDINRIDESNENNNFVYQGSICVAGSPAYAKIIAPLDSMKIFDGADLTILADAYKCGADLTKVVFYSGSTKLGEDTSSPYSWTISGISIGTYQFSIQAFDQEGNVVKDTVVDISVEPIPDFGIIRNQWDNVNGTSIAELTSNNNFPNKPSSSVILKDLFEGPVDAADNYGAWYSGYITAPQTGNYIFAIASDDQSELWLSTDTKITNKKKIAFVSSWTNSRAWDVFSEQTSSAIALVKDQKYYIEAFHKEGSGGDNLSVKWTLPDGTEEGPIPATRIVPAIKKPVVVTGVGEIPDSRFIIYPVPAHDKIIVTSNISGEVRIELLDMMGQINAQSQVNYSRPGTSLEINISHLKTGIYVVRIKSGNHYESKRIVKE